MNEYINIYHRHGNERGERERGRDGPRWWPVRHAVRPTRFRIHRSGSDAPFHTPPLLYLILFII